jgi:hypothetical protein
MRNRQNYSEYIFSRVEFALAVGLFLEFDHEVNLRSDFSDTQYLQEWKYIKSNILNIKYPKAEEWTHKTVVMPEAFLMLNKFAGILKTNPKIIFDKLYPYITSFPEIKKVEFLNGFMNIYYNRTNYLLNLL